MTPEDLYKQKRPTIPEARVLVKMGLLRLRE